MTFFPQRPNLLIDNETGIATLQESHLTIVKMWLGYSLMVYIKPGFKTDGASVPKEDLENNALTKEICKIIAKHYPGKDYKETLDYLIGIPFEMPRLLAAIVHDALYGIKWKIRWICDRVYKKILSNIHYDDVRKDIEYTGIRLLGWKNWRKVSKKKQKEAKKFVVAKLIDEKDKN